jgi:hypothetical protein
METESSLPHLQVPTACPNPEPDLFYRHLFNEYSLWFLRLSFKICTNNFKSKNWHTVFVCVCVCVCVCVYVCMYVCLLWFLPKQLRVLSAHSFNRIVSLKTISVFSARTKWNLCKTELDFSFQWIKLLKIWLRYHQQHHHHHHELV